jgi:hypothetical protein
MEEKSKICPHCEEEFLTREKMVLHAIGCELRVWTHEEWTLICPSCGDRRMLWPANQNISSLKDPKATFVHSNGYGDCS